MSLQLSASSIAPAIRAGRLDTTTLYAEIAKRHEDVKFWGIFPGGGAAPAPLAAPPSAPKGALAGVPFVVTPDFDVDGSATHSGVDALRVCVASGDAPCVGALKGRGAVLLGAVTASEFGLAVTGGLAKNPFTTFGLSGGSAAAAVGARVATLGLAVDTTGAVRASAALCGVTAFRPTHGRYTRGGTLGLSPTLGTVSVIARSVRDVQLVDAVLCTATAGAAAAPAAPAPAAPAGAAADAEKNEAALKMQSLARGFTSRRRVAKAKVGTGLGALLVGAEGLTTPTKGAALRASRLASHSARGAERLSALEAGEGEPAQPPAVGPGSPSSPHPLLPRGLFAAELEGVRIGVPRGSPMFSSLPPGALAVVEAALSRLQKAGAVLVDVALEGEGGEDLGAQAGACAAALLGYEAPRELAAYALTRTVPQPAPPKAAAGEGEEEAPEEGEEGAKKAPPPLVPLDTVVAPSAVMRGYKGPLHVKALLGAQLAHGTAVTASQYRSALVHTRPSIKRAFTTMFKANKLAALVYPATVLPPAMLKGAELSAVEFNGAAVVRGFSSPNPSSPCLTPPPHTHAHTPHAQDATTVYTSNLVPASVAGLPCVVVPCGLTKPKASAQPGTPEAERLPVALEFAGTAEKDEKLLALAAAFQRLAPLLADPIVIRAFQSGVARD
jgi:Asp-tRNA(Asn)/Glu-tRNA(Gln) amidotransferase A subunit family amidase